MSELNAQLVTATIACDAQTKAAEQLVIQTLQDLVDTNARLDAHDIAMRSKSPVDHIHNSSDIGLGNLPNAKSDSIYQNNTEVLATSAAVYAINTKFAQKADLVNGKIPTSQLPGYMDSVLSYPLRVAFPVIGVSGTIYLDESTNKTYRWSGTVYVVIGSDLALGTTSSTAYRGDLGQLAYDHSQISHAPFNAEANVQSDWNSVSGSTFIKNKPATFPATAHNHTPSEVGLSNIPNAISDSVQLTSSSTIASSTAVKFAYDKAVVGVNTAAEASTSAAAAYDRGTTALNAIPDKATADEADDGTNNEHFMTPYLTVRAIIANEITKGTITTMYSSGTYTPPANAFRVVITLVGGGGGGGGYNGGAGGAGGNTTMLGLTAYGGGGGASSNYSAWGTNGAGGGTAGTLSAAAGSITRKVNGTAGTWYGYAPACGGNSAYVPSAGGASLSAYAAANGTGYGAGGGGARRSADDHRGGAGGGAGLIEATVNITGGVGLAVVVGGGGAGNGSTSYNVGGKGTAGIVVITPYLRG